MPAGRIPKPKAVSDLKGGHWRRKNKKEPEPPINRPECPEYLDAIAKAEWEYVTLQLESMGLLSSADRGAIELLCVAYSEYRRCLAMIAKYGSVLVSKKTGG